jgi:hypothetical protein
MTACTAKPWDFDFYQRTVLTLPA